MWSSPFHKNQCASNVDGTELAFPQFQADCLKWGETHNNVFGRTLNPYNRSLTPGGSSGGEGALVAMKGSPLGVGTDIGGFEDRLFI